MQQTRPTSKIAVFILSLAVIDLLLVAVFVAYLVTTLFPAVAPEDPRFPSLVISRHQLTVSSCQRAAQMASQPQAQVVSDVSQATISRDSARHIADIVLTAYLGRSEPDNHAGPELLRATLPDGQQRLVWYRLWIRPGGNVSYENNALVMYVDATTGEALVLFTDITMIDPVFAGCDNFPEMTDADMTRIALPVLVPILILMFLLGIAGLFWGIRRL